MFIIPRLRNKASRKTLQQGAYQRIGQYTEHRSSPNPNGNINMLIIFFPLILAQPAEKPIAERRPSKAHQSTCQLVPRIVYSQIRTGITRQQSPYHNEPVQGPVAEQIKQEESQSECIGGMAGREAICPTPITVHDMHKFRNRILQIGRTKAAHQRPDNSRPYLIGKSNGQRNSYGTAYGNFPMQITYYHIENCCVQRHPDPFSTKGIHEKVRPLRTCSVDCEQQVGIHFHQPR